MATNTFQYTPINPYLLLLRLWEEDLDYSPLIPCLEALGNAIRRCSQVISCAGRNRSEDYVEAVTDQQTEVIETLLGTTFVLCQTYIACTVSSAERLECFFQQKEKRTLNALENTEKTTKLRHGARAIDGTGYTDIQAIHAFANYFKHRDSWTIDWNDLPKGNQTKTRDIVCALGADPTSSGNLRAAAEVLGNCDYGSVLVFANRLESWSKELKNRYKAQLETENVI